MKTRRRHLLGCIVLLAAGAVGCYTAGRRVSENRVYTLYRNSVFDSLMRIHVATFDADQDEAYNNENCEVARGLFQAQPGISTRFWCEKGYFNE